MPHEEITAHLTASRWPSVANMVSYHHSPQEVQELHAKHLTYYKASVHDCVLLDTTVEKRWRSSHECQEVTVYQLRINTYLGWKVYMLHTGCFASIPEFESSDYYDVKPKQRCLVFHSSMQQCMLEEGHAGMHETKDGREF